jgi:hypothetical protein
MRNATATKLYLVRRRLVGNESPRHNSGRGPIDPRIEGTFANRDDAETFCRQREHAARLSRRDSGLFWYQAYATPTLFDFTCFDPPVFLDWLEDADIPRPHASDALSWSRWWGQVRNHLTKQQRHHLFEGLHKFSFYEIVAIAWYDGDADIPPEELETIPPLSPDFEEEEEEVSPPGLLRYVEGRLIWEADEADRPPEEVELANAEFDDWHNDIPWDGSDPPNSEPETFDEIPF